MARRVLRALARRAGAGDVEALQELVALQDALRDAITDAGRGLHAAGFSYTYIAAETGVTRQAARKRYGKSTTLEIDDCPTCGRGVDAIEAPETGPPIAWPCGDRVAVTMWPDRAELGSPV